jgi:hypothetical protein
MAILVSALALFLLWRYSEHFAGLVKSTPMRAESGSQQIVASTPAGNPDFESREKRPSASRLACVSSKGARACASSAPQLSRDREQTKTQTKTLMQ